MTPTAHDMLRLRRAVRLSAPLAEGPVACHEDLVELSAQIRRVETDQLQEAEFGATPGSVATTGAETLDGTVVPDSAVERRRDPPLPAEPMRARSKGIRPVRRVDVQGKGALQATRLAIPDGQ